MEQKKVLNQTDTGDATVAVAAEEVKKVEIV